MNAVKARTLTLTRLYLLTLGCFRRLSEHAEARTVHENVAVQASFIERVFDRLHGAVIRHINAKGRGFCAGSSKLVREVIEL